jgi:para-nitrobenzyl esterase
MKTFMINVAMLLAASAASAAVTEPVKTDAGLVSGAGGNDAAVSVFKGIPYAAPPVGPLRWKAPQPLYDFAFARMMSPGAKRSTSGN